ncbi:uncharacterized protein EV422DRAFT_521614 [Fimicolochytrium jonesii]|uniref:uncharacterized protein n=1 Tax=Fimicolochytrium jonesii TaxID=1396493 RepID=UPI0022FE9E03|nr:uncharacterized protein EV422DRAFT_521614 [Fimicolochytrium jonesii]KAI8823603.1 hypothetical protein EV422DRAFT_521614 [Fimicolochytrium jonesii]
MGFFSTQDIAALKKYKYSGVDKSIISRYVLNPYWWNNLVKVFPLWFAPNLITLSGLSLVVLNLLTVLYYSPDLGEPCPNWVYYACAAGVFAYQSLDAIDGKQARRTGTSGPLGELFDQALLAALITASALNLHSTWWVIISILCAVANFYLSTWEEYHTGTLYLGYCSGPVEGVLFVVGLLIATGVYGPPFWDTQLRTIVPQVAKSVPVLLSNAKLSELFLALGAGILIVNIVGSASNVAAACRTNRNKNFGGALLGLLPFVAFVGSIVSWAATSPTILVHHIVPFSLLIGTLFAHQVGKMIIAHVCHRPFPYFDFPTTVVLVLGNLSAHVLSHWKQTTAAGGHHQLDRSPLAAAAQWIQQRLQVLFMGHLQQIENATFMEGAVVHGLLCVAVFVYLRFAMRVINHYCEIFDCYCLRIKKKVDTSKKL